MKLLPTLFAALLGSLPQAHAAEIAVLSAGAIEPGLKSAIRAFEKAGPHSIKVTFNTAPQLRKRMEAGEAWDVVIAPPGAIEAFAKANRLAEERADVGRVGLGVAVRPDAPVPDIASSAAIRKTVLDADSIVFNRASTGLYFEELLKKMEVWTAVEGKTVRYPDGASVMEHLLRGKGREVGFGPITEILLVKDRGLKLVGPLPPDIQNYTSYTAAPLANAAQADAARAFVRHLGAPATKALFVAAGVE